MGDIYCAKCGEPWDSYGVFNDCDMTASEKDRFLQGEGCPCCAFGQKAPKGIDFVDKFLCSALEETDEPDSLLELWS